LGQQTFEDYTTYRTWESSAISRALGEIDEYAASPGVSLEDVGKRWEAHPTLRGATRSNLQNYATRVPELIEEARRGGAGVATILGGGPSLPEIAASELEDWEGYASASPRTPREVTRPTSGPTAEDWEWYDKNTPVEEGVVRERPVPRRQVLTRSPGWFSKLGWKSKAALGVGATAAAIFAMSRFSGKDDQYNTLEGLPENGLARQQRHLLTQFGSGWMGISGGMIARETLEWSDDFARIYFQYRMKQPGNGQTFSGRDDEYNKIRGLPHGGWAQHQRRMLTEFGSGWTGLQLMGTGAAVLGALGIAGYALRDAPKRQEKSEGIASTLKGWGSTAAGWAGSALKWGGILAGAGIAIKTLPTVIGSKVLGGASWKDTWGLVKAGFKSEWTQQKLGWSAAAGMWTDKSTVEALKAAGREAYPTGIYSTALGRMTRPIQDIAKPVEHTARWLGKNWWPQLKKGDPGALLLGAATVYEGYEIGKNAYEGEWGKVATGIASFAAAKYAYMGYHKFLRTAEARKATFGFLKSQTWRDWAGYASSAMSLTQTAVDAGIHYAEFTANFVRTGAPPLKYAEQYGLKMAEKYAAAGHDIMETYKGAWKDLPEPVRQKIANIPKIQEIIKNAKPAIEEAKLDIAKTAVAGREQFEGFTRNLKEVGVPKEAQDLTYWAGYLNKKIKGMDDIALAAKLHGAKEKVVGAVEKGTGTGLLERLHKTANDIAARRSAASGAIKYVGPEVVPEGMAHGNMSSTKRKLRTDFGSRWKGLIGSISGKLAKFLATGAKSATSLLDPRKAAKMAEGATLEQFAERLGVRESTAIMRAEDMDIWQKALAAQGKDINKIASAGMVGPGNIQIHLPRAQEEFRQMAVKAGMSEEAAKAAVTHEDFGKAILYHEYLERGIHLGFAKPREMASHLGAQVMLGEAGFVSNIGNAHVRELFTRVRTSKHAFRAERQLFKAGLEAFGEGNAASASRKLISDFGSGYRGLLSSTSKSIAKTNSMRGRASQKLTESAQDLRIAQKVIWEAGIRGGKGHTKYAGSHVKQLSRFGGGI
jgi:hypothetical protein